MAFIFKIYMAVLCGVKTAEATWSFCAGDELLEPALTAFRLCLSTK